MTRRMNRPGPPVRVGPGPPLASRSVLRPGPLAMRPGPPMVRRPVVMRPGPPIATRRAVARPMGIRR